MKAIFLLLSLFAGVIAATAQGPKKQSVNFSKELFDLEIAFSKASREIGFRVANLNYAADDAIVFRPYEINAKEWSNRLKGQDSAYQITWYASVVVASSSGDLGYCSGPFENISTVPGDNRVLNKGQFFTIWKRQRDGNLRFVMDFGSGALDPKEYVNPEPVFVPPSNPKDNKTFPNVGWNEILSLEQKYGLECQKVGDLSALQKFASQDICFFYQSKFYARGVEALGKRPEVQTGYHAWLPVGGMVSESGDLAYVYGSHRYFNSQADGGRTGYYMRIWKRGPENQWLISVQVRSLLPEPQKK